MQLFNIELRLGGNQNSTVHKTDVTPAEVQVLWAIHGADAVVNVRPTKMDKRSHRAEFERLTGLYGRAPDGLMDAGNGALLEKLFPGANKVLPISAKDIGREDWMNPHASQESDNGDETDPAEGAGEGEEAEHAEA